MIETGRLGSNGLKYLEMDVLNRMFEATGLLVYALCQGIVLGIGGTLVVWLLGLVIILLLPDSNIGKVAG